MIRFDAAPFLSLAAAIAIAACGLIEPDEDAGDALADARNRWAARAITSYQYRFTHQCGECLPDFSRTYEIRVVAGEVVEMRNTRTGDPPPDGYATRTVPDLFAVVSDAIASRAYTLVVEYHATLGYPALISVDYDREIADDEFVMTAEALEPLP